ncbi:LPD7 domain-containing protein [Caballeronia sordidicola]|uniref:IncQ plasmid conjugative transfer DNA primase TraO (PTi TraA) n=1 Tax=Caballeronia sordidicola TaxID=196367 RepID=A0A226X591_CABSO|nr:LPD7 domain-containing protein [Caballeronia sordidicola]OXC78616.1 IncQ plasmid conjugative transfer DNA primase TraO (pTi TraA) [Caballeronia sordidicola]
MVDSTTPAAVTANPPTADAAAIQAARDAFLKRVPPPVDQSASEQSPMPSRARAIEGPSDAPMPQAQATPAHQSDIASRNAVHGEGLVEGLAALATEKAYRSWVQQDVAEIRAIQSPDERAGALAHLVSNAAAPGYAQALREADPDLAKEVDEARASLPVTTQAEAVTESPSATVDNPVEGQSASALISPSISARAADPLPPIATGSTPAAIDVPEHQDETSTAAQRARPARENDEKNSVEGLGGVRIATPEIERQKRAQGVASRVLEAMSRPFTLARTDSAAHSPSAPSEMRAPAVMTKTGYAIPEDIAARYVVRDGSFWKFDGKDPGQSADHEPHFEDHGARLATPANDRNTAADMIAVAQAKGWGAIELKGSDEFKRNAWIEASLAGIATKGFKPQEQDLAMLDAARREREALTITAGARVKTDVPAPAPAPAARTAATPPVMPIAPAAQAPIASPTTEVATPPVAASAPVTNPTPVVASVLVAHGPAPYQNDPENSRSYFVTVKDAAGAEKTSWGIDLERAIGDSGVRIGDPVKLENLCNQPVVVQAPVKDDAGKVIGYEPKETRRNVWSVERDGPAAPVRDVREELEKAIATLPENVRRVVMDRFAETMAAGLKVQDEHVRSESPAEALGPALDARLAQVTQERVVRETPPAAPSAPAPKRDNPGQGAPALAR